MNYSKYGAKVRQSVFDCLQKCLLVMIQFVEQLALNHLLLIVFFLERQ